MDNNQARRPQVGDIAIHNQNNVLLYVGVVERISSYDPNMCEGSAIVTGMDNQFYECAKLHYWHADRADTVFVPRPSMVPEPMQIIPAVPMEHDKALAEEHVDASAPSNICAHCDGTGLEPEPTAAYPPESCSVCRGSRVANVSVGVLGSNPDEEPF